MIRASFCAFSDITKRQHSICNIVWQMCPDFSHPKQTPKSLHSLRAQYRLIVTNCTLTRD